MNNDISFRLRASARLTLFIENKIFKILFFKHQQTFDTPLVDDQEQVNQETREPDIIHVGQIIYSLLSIVTCVHPMPRTGIRCKLFDCTAASNVRFYWKDGR